MKDKCAGSGKKPRRKIGPEFGAYWGECPDCPSQRRLRVDGRLVAHHPSPNYNHIVRELLSTPMVLLSRLGGR